MRVPKIVPHLTVLAALAALLVLGGSSPAHAGGKNTIRGVAIRDEAGATTVRIQGSGTPTFTVYKLERPSHPPRDGRDGPSETGARVVIDLAQATLDRSVRGDEPSATFAVGSWSVSQVAAMAMEDGSTSVRVVVTLARPGRYDVKADGKDVVVKVIARDPAPKTANTEELDAARAEITRVQSEAAAAKKEADEARAQARAAQEAVELEQRRAKAAGSASASERAAADKRIGDARAEAARAKTAAERAEAEAGAAKAAADAEIAKMKSDTDARIARAKTDADAQIAKAKTDADAEVAKARAAAAAATDQARADVERERRAASLARADAERDRQAAAQARADAERTMADAKAKLAKVEADRKRVEAEARAAERARDEAKAAAARADERERGARTAEEKAAAERKQAQDAVAKAKAATVADDDKIKDAEARLARAEAARIAAENARKDAERAAGLARQEAERAATAAKKDAAAAQAAVAAAATARTQADAATREAMAARATAESQRAAAEQRTADTLAEAERAELRRTQAEAEAARAVDRRRVEEAAAAQAAAARKTEEAAAAKAATARRADEAAAAQAATARKTEEAAVARARAARQTEEQAMQAAAAARTAAENRKQAAERAADDAERAVAMERDAAKVARDRKRAADDADAEAKAAARRKASADEIATARAEAARLAAEREKAERELADRTKDVARTRAEAERLAAAKADAAAEAERLGKERVAAAAEAERLAKERTAAAAEVTRLKQAAADARDARAREEARLADVTRARQAEEQALAKARAKPAVVTPPAPPPAAEPKVATKPPVAKPSAKITAVRFTPADNEHAVVVDLDGKGATAELVRTGTRKAELVVHGATLPADLARTLDTSRFGGPIRAVSSYTDPKSGDVRVVVELTSDVTPRFDTDGGDLRLAFAATPRVRTQSVPGPVVGGFGATSTPVTQTSVAQLGKKKVYRGPTIELDFKDADIHDLLRTLADVGRVNIVVPEEVRAQVTVRMKRVPWDQALDVILASKGLGYRKEGNLYRVAPQKQLDAEDEAEAARLRALVEMEAPKPEVYRLNYTDAESVKPVLEPLLSPKGKIEVDKRTNSIVVNDVSRNRREIIDLVNNLDTQTPQISIEARIVEARSQYERQIGIQWGGRALAGAAGGNATGLIFPSTIGFQGGSSDQQKPENGVAAPADFAVNLPVGGTQGALGLTLGSVGGNVNINLRLSALEETGTVRIISAPKVTVLNNIEAEMKQGVKIPISIVSAEGTQTQFVRAELSLKVTPYVSQRDCAIMMDVQVTKDEPDFVNTGARGDPTILNKEAKTRMLVNDGETSVMGGIYTRNSGLSYSKIPFFGDLPVFGWLFKRRVETDDRAELLIFITPKITNKASLRCVP